ncbi:unnamed protein product [Mytilus edulis]|uniref:DNA 3'-5' helicase n=1 Tax=Mytilus edulis TaxID=6550 RepID=A0A8S3R3A7_MYTED|nr:unnamed protein product [Mytilus edulis]
MAPPIVNRCDAMFIEKLQQIIRIMHALFTINSCRNTEYRFLKPKQVDCLLHLKESDVIACLKTSYGKSLIFESLAHLHLRSSVLIINPLNSIITEQLDRYGSMAICVSPELLQRLQKHSCSTMSLDCVLCKFVSAKFKFVIGHPEHFLNKVIIDIFSNAAWQETSTSIVIDEAHCVEKWGADFRKDYKKLSMLRSTFPNAKVLALTGTATKQTCEAIKKTLHLTNLKIVSTSIVRDNIKLTCKKRPVQNSTDSHGSVLMPIIKELKEKQDRFPKTVIYSKLKWCAAGYQLAMLPENNGTPVDETMKTLVSQYHAPSTDQLKQHVVQQMSSDSLRLLFATEAYSMGTDAPDIRRIIHFGVPNSLETYMQEVGRAGRNGKDSSAIMYFNNYDIGNNMPLEPKMKDFIMTSECRWKFLSDFFGVHFDRTVLHHNCCDNCELACMCELCKEPLHADDSNDYEAKKPKKPRLAMNKKKILITMLQQYFDAENEATGFPINIPKTGLSSDLLNSIINSVHEIKNKDQVLNINQHLSISFAENIALIVNHVQNMNN